MNIIIPMAKGFGMQNDRHKQSMLRILLVDERTPFRDSLENLLQGRFASSLVETADSCKAGEGFIATHSPQIVFINIHLSQGKGLELARQAKNRFPHVTIMAIADHDLPEYHVAARQAGVDFYIPKDQWSCEKMLDLVESIIASVGKT